jgi:hypothetical protein
MTGRCRTASGLSLDFRIATIMGAAFLARKTWVPAGAC